MRSTTMGNTIRILTALIFIVMVSACANSEDKWSNGNADNKATDSSSTWQKDKSAAEADTARKSSPGSYWSDKSSY